MSKNMKFHQNNGTTLDGTGIRLNGLNEPAIFQDIICDL